MHGRLPVSFVRFWPLCCLTFALCFFSCGSQDDGPLNAFDDQWISAGHGHYFAAELDSGALIHLWGDSLSVDLQKVWTIADCYLQSMDPLWSVVDSTATLSFDLPLYSNPDPLCASYSSLRDTLIQVPLNTQLEKTSRLLLYGRDSVSQSENVILDSVYLRRGVFDDSSWAIQLDSEFLSSDYWPWVSGNNPWIVRLPQDTTIRMGSDSLPDTLITPLTLWVEQLQPCEAYNRVTASRLTLVDSTGAILRFWREVYHPDSSEQPCGVPWGAEGLDPRGKPLMQWQVYPLGKTEPWRDTLQIDSLLSRIGLDSLLSKVKESS